MWQRRISWIVFFLAGLAFLVALAIHVAALGGVNPDQIVRRISTVVEAGLIPAIVVWGPYFFPLFRHRKSAMRLPLAVRRGAILLAGLVVVYVLVGASFGLLSIFLGRLPQLGSAEWQLYLLRNDSRTWLFVYGLVAFRVAQHGLGWQL